MADSTRLARTLWLLAALFGVVAVVIYASLIWVGCQPTGPMDFVDDVAAFHSAGGC